MKLHPTLLALVVVSTMTTVAHADFPVRQTANPSFPPAVAYNSTDHQYLAVWSELTWNGSAYLPALMGQRLGEDGSLLGSAFQIFFIGSSPTVAYNRSANEYLVGFNPGTGYAGQRVSAAGNLVGNLTGLLDGVSHGRLVYNSLTNQYLFLGAILNENPAGSGNYNIQLKSRKIGADGQPLNSPVTVDDRPHGYQPTEPSFGIAFAPIQTSETPNGRYLLVIGHGVALKMLDSDGVPMNVVHDPDHPELSYQYIPFKTGNTLGGEFGVDVAYGTSSAYSMTGPAFLVVWADNNNSFGGHAWTGIYGGFLDPTKTDYLTSDVTEDHSFPLSFEWDHWARDPEAETWRPKVAFNYSSQKFYVAWREMPGTNSQDDTHVNHIRGADVFERIPSSPAANVIISATNAAADPGYPAVASSSTSEHALVVWQDYRDKGSGSANVYGSVQKVADPVPPPPPPPPTTTWVVTNTNDAGTGSLRQAILKANARIGMDTIAFNIPGSGLHSIQPLSELPTITDPVLIDGYTQLGASVNTGSFTFGTNATLKIELDGTNLGRILRISSGNSTIRGLFINRCYPHPTAPPWSAAITLEGGGNNVVEGNIVGVDPTGTTFYGNSVGVLVSSSSGNRIGGTLAHERNLFGSHYSGIEIKGSGSTNTTVQGNYIGINPATPAQGTFGITRGIGLTDASSNVIGGTDPEAANLIAATYAIALSGFSAANSIQGNLIGTDVSGAAPNGPLAYTGIMLGDSANSNLIGGKIPGTGNVIAGRSSGIVIVSSGNIIRGNRIGVPSASGISSGNTAPGIVIFSGSHPVEGNIIGGSDDGEGNIISFNGREGIRVESGSVTAKIIRNSIFANGGVGINLVGGTEDANGVTANDPGDADTGPNNLQNYPVLTSVEGGDYLSIQGTLNSTPNTTFRLEFFSTPTQETGGSRQGKTYLTSTDVVTDGNGNAGFSFTYGSPIGSGNAITATATDPNGNTSEFSDPVLIQYTSGDFAVTNTDDDGPGSLRQAILAANALSGKNTISFNIPGTGVHVIQPKTGLPPITEPIVIDGYTQPGSQPNSNGLQDPCNAVPLIVLDGTLTKPQYLNYDYALVLRGGNSRVRGLVIRGFGGYALYLTGAGSDVIEGNFLGVDPDGHTANGNLLGVFVDTVSYNTIGGTDPAARNIISGNGGEGIEIFEKHADHNLVQGNFIGVDASGVTPLSNGGSGVEIWNGYANTIGGGLPGAGNVMARFMNGNLGNDGCIHIFGPRARSNIVAGNLLGVTVSSEGKVGNTDYGVMVDDSANVNTIGGTSESARNVISGFGMGGILVQTDSNRIQGNYVGTDITGTKAIPSLNGILIRGSGNRIGGRTSGAGNLISGNIKRGIKIVALTGDPDVRDTRIEGNRIGTQADGSSPLGNVFGVGLYGRAYDNTIGDTVAGAGNIIAFNGDGVEMTLDASSICPISNRISGNSIYANESLGIYLGGGAEDEHGMAINDPGDFDSGPNDLQNFPVLTSAEGGSSLHIRGSLNSSANSTFTIEFFGTAVDGTPKVGEGQTYLGSTIVQTDASGNASITTTLNVPVAAGRAITATATNYLNSTSEFSLPVVTTVTGVENDPNQSLPRETALLQNYPNPFNPKTGIRYQVSGVREAGAGNPGPGVSVKLVVYDLLGREVAVLVNERKVPGTYEATFDGSRFASGVYVYRMTAGSFVAVKTMLLVK